MLASAFVALAVAGLATPALGAALEKRAIVCNAFTPSIAAIAPAQQTLATRYCSSYLGIVTKTRTVTSTTATSTITVNQGTYTTATAFVTPSNKVVTRSTVQTVKVTTTPAAITTTVTQTQTAYLDGDGNTMTVMKRDAMPTALAKRAPVAAPLIFNGYPRASLSAACSCMNIPTPTVNKVINVQATSTVTNFLSRTIKATTTLPAVTVETTAVQYKTINYAAKAPMTTANVLAIVPSYGCPPPTVPSFQCPAGTGATDENDDPDVISCSVASDDGYQGYCSYWTDDGSPAGSTLTLGDGSGDTSGDETRDASYGDSDADDCASFADYLCANAGQSRLVRLAARAAHAGKAQSAIKPKAKTSAEKKAHRSSPKKTIPVPPPRRGGHMIGFAPGVSLPKGATFSAVKTITVSPAAAGKSKPTSPVRSKL